MDSMEVPGTVVAAKQQSASDVSRLIQRSPDILADSLNNLAKAKRIDDGHKEMHWSITFIIVKLKNQNSLQRLKKLNSFVCR
jgi:hypothetical protein